MMNKLHENIVRYNLSNGSSVEHIKQLSFLQSLEPDELDILIAQIQKEQSNNSTAEVSAVKHLTPQYRTPQSNLPRTNNKYDEVLCFRLDKEILNGLNKYLKKSGAKKSFTIRTAIKEFLLRQ